MRLNQYIALHTGLSRRGADQLIKNQKVLINSDPAVLGQIVGERDKILVNGLEIRGQTQTTTIMLNKPVGYVCSRAGQGSKIIYDLLPSEFHNLKPVGRLDKDSSGLILLTNDGKLANKLTHPRYQKEKVYEVELDRPLAPIDKSKIESGVMLQDGRSSCQLSVISGQSHSSLKTNDYQLTTNRWRVAISEGRNRQIRRTFAAVGYNVIKLHRTKFGNYQLDNLRPGNFKIVIPAKAGIQ